MKFPEKNRIEFKKFGRPGEPHGAFQLYSPFRPRHSLLVIANDANEHSFGWQHVSVRGGKPSIIPSRGYVDCLATWDEMNWVKDIFWDAEETVVQFHPAKSQYVNFNPFVLHLWRHAEKEFQLPPGILVGPSKVLEEKV